MVPTLPTVFWIFLRLGSIGFGGPIALISLMEQECSHRLKWLTLAEFNERYVFAKLLPGPIASQMAMWVGYQVRGRVGAIVAGIAFLLPAFVLILVLSFSYSLVTATPSLAPVILGMELGAIVVIFDSVLRMNRPYQHSVQAWIFLLIATLLMLKIPRWEPVIIICGGLAMILWKRLDASTFRSLVPFSLLFDLFWVHFKAGATVFGTGLAIIPVLQHEIVEVYQWMTRAEFLDGIAFGQITPGPVTISSVFVGYRAAGVPGSLAACIGMYSPGAIMILFVMPFIFNRLKGRPFLTAFQQGAIPTVIGCILGASLLLVRDIVTDLKSLILVLSVGLIGWKFKLPGWGLIILGSLLSILSVQLFH